MLLEKIKDKKFKTLTMSSMAMIVGGATTGGGRQYLGDYHRMVPTAVNFNGKITTQYVDVVQAKYRVWDSDDSECTCYGNEREVWG